ncbi:MAG: translation initiation factor IF-2 [Flavobacteriales bacterium]|nr:translation initiation factor IF-2 [Flavobacteriales bacterium]
MAEDKRVRIGKVLKELGIGLATAKEFLESKGYEDINPNTGLDDKGYDLLLSQFAADRKVKQEADKKAEVLKERKDERLAASDRHPEPEAPVVKTPVAPATPVTPTTPEPQPVVTAAPISTPAQEVDEEKGSAGPKILGTMDLSSIDPRERKKQQAVKEKQQREDAEKQAAEKAATDKLANAAKLDAEKAKLADDASKAAAAELEKKTAADALKTAEPEVIRAVADRLAGTKVLGKMELPVEKERKPVASSTGGADNKRKRKRVRVDEPAAAAPRPLGTGPAAAKGRREVKPALTEEEIQKQVKETLARLTSGGGKSKASKHRRDKRAMVQERMQEEFDEHEREKSTLKVTEFVTANDLAQMMDVPVTNIISACMSLGLFVSINQRLDAETLSIVAEEFGFGVEFVSADFQDAVHEEMDRPEDIVERAPIVTIMGHVDHGKTSLLDFIRSANVVAGEAGGITQHIGAYSVEVGNGKRIAFLDTPGHEAFTAMRARGAQVTDIAIIVVAADDDIMPQTKEAINHAQAAGVPMIFAINKIDKPNANPEKIKEQLAQMNLLVEDWGGKYQSQEIAAKFGTNVDKLLEKVLLEAELLELKGNPKKRAVGTVIESELDKGRGFVSTVLVQSGTLHVGDVMLAGCFSGKVKAIFNERGQNINEAGPSMPAQVLGLNGAPQAGDKFAGMEDEREARDIANKRLQLQREQGLRTRKHITLDEIGRRIAIGNFQELNLIVKGDVDGSIEALSDSLLKLSTDKIAVNILMKGVGAITETDVMLASASDAIIIGFQVRPSMSARKIAEQEQIQIKLYSIIYDAIEEVKAAMEGMLAPEYEEKIVGNIEVRDVFKITRVGSVAGCMVLDGKFTRQTKVRVIRDGIVVYTGELASLKRFKEDVKEVAKGYECGLNINNFNDIKVGDIIEGYEIVEVKAKL